MKAHRATILTATEAIEKKERSARTGGLLLQSKMAEIEEKIAGGLVEMNESSIDLLSLRKEMKATKANINSLHDDIKNAKSSIVKAADDAARLAVENLNREAIREEVQRQFRLMKDADD